MDPITNDGIADALEAGIRKLRSLTFVNERHSVTLSWQSYSEELALDVHGCMPGELEIIRDALPQAHTQVDEDSILRWVTVNEGGVEVTFFRR